MTATKHTILLVFFWILLATAALTTSIVEAFTVCHGGDTSPSSLTTTTRLGLFHPNRRDRDQDNDGDGVEAAAPLKLSANDRARFQQLHSRQIVDLPMLIIPDALVPMQQTTLTSSDVRFTRLVQHCRSTTKPLILVGLNPRTGRPLSHGVTVEVPSDGGINSILPTLTVTANERVQVQGQPWLIKDGFYMAKVEILSQPTDNGEVSPTASPQLRRDVRRLSAMIPRLTQEWIRTVHHKKKTTKKKTVAADDLPTHPTDRAHWVAALLYPDGKNGANSALTDIRPALLSCNNDYDRLVLAVQALQSSLAQYRGSSSSFD